MLVISNSPSVLSPLGISLLDKSGGKEYVDQHLDELISELESLNLTTAYDVQLNTTVTLTKSLSTIGGLFLFPKVFMILMPPRTCASFDPKIWLLLLHGLGFYIFAPTF